LSPVKSLHAQCGAATFLSKLHYASEPENISHFFTPRTVLK